jgi:hypothetical protein
VGESQAGEMFAWGRKRESRIDEQARPCAPLLSLSLSLLVAGGGDLDCSMCLESGKWSCDGIDVRRSMRGGSMRYQLEAAGAAGSMCICTRIE